MLCMYVVRTCMCKMLLPCTCNFMRSRKPRAQYREFTLMLQSVTVLARLYCVCVCVVCVPMYYVWHVCVEMKSV